jgi:hypothetical protein
MHGGVVAGLLELLARAFASHGPTAILSELSETGSAATHHFTLADQLSIKFGSVKREVYVEIDAIEGALRRIHAFKVLLKVLAGQV